MTGVVRPCFHARMAKHEAAEGAASHPLVAEGLRRRARERVGTHREELPGRRGPIGWPVPEPDPEGGGIGWPGGLPGSPGSEDSADDESPADPVRGRAA
jgi:hypothetical protein